MPNHIYKGVYSLAQKTVLVLYLLPLSRQLTYLDYIKALRNCQFVD